MSNQDKKNEFTRIDKNKCFLNLNEILHQKELLAKAENMEKKGDDEVKELNEIHKNDLVAYHSTLILIYKKQLQNLIDKI